MNRKRILVIEDDDAIRRGVVDTLESAGYLVLEAASFDEGVRAALGADYDLLLLDLVLPQGDGLDLLARLRAARPRVPVIVLTARGEEEDRVRGLRLGADDYVVKPFGVKELLARIAAVLRRAPSPDGDTGSFAIPGGRVDMAAQKAVFDDGTEAPIAGREIALFRYLAANAGRPVPREEILARVWGLNMPGIETRTVDVHVARLREKLRDDAVSPRIIKTIRSKGYCLVDTLAARPRTRKP